MSDFRDQTMRYKIPVIITLLAAIGMTAVVWLGRTRPVEVSVRPVGYGSVQDTVANTRAGTIKACRRAGISPSIGGQIASLPVKEGDAVKAGHVLMELWNDDLLAQLEQATSEAKAVEASARPDCDSSRRACGRRFGRNASQYGQSSVTGGDSRIIEGRCWCQYPLQRYH